MNIFSFITQKNDPELSVNLETAKNLFWELEREARLFNTPQKRGNISGPISLNFILTEVTSKVSKLLSENKKKKIEKYTVELGKLTKNFDDKLANFNWKKHHILKEEYLTNFEKLQVLDELYNNLHRELLIDTVTIREFLLYIFLELNAALSDFAKLLVSRYPEIDQKQILFLIIDSLRDAINLLNGTIEDPIIKNDGIYSLTMKMDQIYKMRPNLELRDDYYYKQKGLETQYSFIIHKLHQKLTGYDNPDSYKTLQAIEEAANKAGVTNTAYVAEYFEAEYDKNELMQLKTKYYSSNKDQETKKSFEEFTEQRKEELLSTQDTVIDYPLKEIKLTNF